MSDDLTRLFAELSAAPTRKEAEDIFFAADWLFIKMNPAEREAVYSKVDDIIREKPG
jgi:hypothetical protein